MRRLLHLCLILTALLFGALAAPVAGAQGLNPALDRFISDSFPDTEAGITAVARSGDPRGATILEALADRRLFLLGKRAQRVLS